MKYQVIVMTDFQTVLQRSMRQIAGFLEQNGLKPSEGETILIGMHLPENAKAALPTEQGRYFPVEDDSMEAILCTLEEVCDQPLVLFSAGGYEEEAAVRLSVRLKGTAVVNAVGLECRKENVAVKKSIYGGHILGTFRLEKAPYILTIDKNQDEKEPVSGSIQCEDAVPCKEPVRQSGWNRIVHPVVHESDLSDASFVIAGGRGLQNKYDAADMMACAETMGAASGGTRPAVMNAWIPHEKLIGVSGESIHPDVCIVCGASGSPAFYAGIAKSKCIIAINKDEHAPIMKKSDVCVCADWHAVLSELCKIWE